MHISIITPGEFKKKLNIEKITYSFYQTAGGCLQVAQLGDAVFEAKFVAQPSLILSGVEGCSEVATAGAAVGPRALLLVGTPFQIRVWQTALAIPAGSTMHYEQLAGHVGLPKAYRAVANALGQNKIAYFIPCHRVVRKNGALSGYRWGLERKAALLQSER